MSGLDCGSKGAIADLGEFRFGEMASHKWREILDISEVPEI